MSRRFLAPVTSRVEDKTVDQILRNHDERIRELAEAARAEGLRWRLWAGTALQPSTQAIAFQRANSIYIAGAASTALLPFDTDPGEKVVAVHALVLPTAAGSMSLRVRLADGGSGAVQFLGPTATSLTTANELLSLNGLASQIERGTFRGYEILIGHATADRVYAVAVETEPI
jgi:hypothetical protein